MTRVVKIAGAASLLALAYAAHAGSGDQLKVALDGTVVSYCTIQNAGYSVSYSAGQVEHGTQGSRLVTFDFGNTFALPHGSGPEQYGVDQNGGIQFNVQANAQCDYTLKSANGALKNTQLPTVWRNYRADAHPGGGIGTGTYVQLDSLSSDKVVNTFPIPAPAGSVATSAVTLEFDIMPTPGPLAAGSYTDTLTLTITPTT